LDQLDEPTSIVSAFLADTYAGEHCPQETGACVGGDKGCVCGFAALTVEPCGHCGIELSCHGVESGMPVALIVSMVAGDAVM
jgi:hypothetical protein